MNRGKYKKMKILILSDIHNKIKPAARIINRHTDWQVGKTLGIFDSISETHDKSNKNYDKVDKVISAGDFFDDFNDTPEIAQRTAWFVNELLEHSNFTWIQSNHDQAYAYCKGKGSVFGCSGFTLEKQKAIKSAMGDRLYQNQLAYWTGIDDGSDPKKTDPNGFLISHAGLHPSFIPPTGFSWGWLEKRLKEAQKKARANIPDPFLMAGMSRGGSEVYGGITWLDWSDFEPISDFRQILGHSPGAVPRRKVCPENMNDNWCLDTHLKHYGILNIEVCRDENGQDYSIQHLDVYNLDGTLW